MIDDLTVAVTSFKRPQYLDRALKSVLSTGIQNIVVATDEPTAGIWMVLNKKEYSHVKVTSLDVDGGCNSLWLRASYHSPTKRMIVLHDDDVLSPDLGKVYVEQIKPAMDKGYVDFCTWRAHLLFDDGKIQPTEWFRGRPGMQSSGLLRDYMLKLGRLSLSPIISIFNRDVLIAALKEAHQYLPRNEACLYHCGMLLGTEVIAYLRHCAEMSKWMYLDQVLSYYGACESSGTVKAQNGGDLRPLITGYDLARKHYLSGTYTEFRPDPRIIFVYDDVDPLDADEKRRFDYAMSTWKFHFNNGDVLEFPTHVGQWGRSSADLGDDRPAPYVKDVLDYGCSFARPEDIVVYANRDICLTTHATERTIEAVKKNGVTVAWRRNFVPISGRLYKNSSNAKRDGGVDLVGISPKWWKENRDLMPDQFLGRETWDWCFRILAEEKHGKSIYVDDVAYHEPHTGQFWKTHKKTNPGQIHNRNLARVFFARRRDKRALMSLQ